MEEKTTEEMQGNYYFEHLKEIVKLSYERNVDWSVAVDMYDNEHGMPEGDIGELRGDFYRYVRTRKYDKDGNEIG